MALVHVISHVSTTTLQTLALLLRIDTGVSVGGQAVKANFQCEQFTFHNRFNGASDFCNRNSKIGLSGVWGEIMFGQWLLPHNEMVAQWVDPFYDAGATSHTSIMGNIGNQDFTMVVTSFIMVVLGASDAWTLLITTTFRPWKKSFSGSRLTGMV